jgi:hypothetical protein
MKKKTADAKGCIEIAQNGKLEDMDFQLADFKGNILIPLTSHSRLQVTSERTAHGLHTPRLVLLRPI